MRERGGRRLGVTVLLGVFLVVLRAGRRLLVRALGVVGARRFHQLLDAFPSLIVVGGRTLGDLPGGGCIGGGFAPRAVSDAVLLPGCVPILGLPLGEAWEEIFRLLDAEVVEEKFRRAVVGDVAAVEHEDAVVEREVPQAVGDGKHDAVVVARELVHELHDLVLGFRVEAAGHFVAE